MELEYQNIITLKYKYKDFLKLIPSILKLILSFKTRVQKLFFLFHLEGRMLNTS